MSPTGSLEALTLSFIPKDVVLKHADLVSGPEEIAPK
jgi:hypothetical protein